MVGYQVERTLSDFGAVSRGVCQSDPEMHLMDVVERTHIERFETGIAYKNDSGTFTNLDNNTLVSMNCWGFTPSFFGYLNRGFEAFIAKNADNLNAEFYIPSVINELITSKTAAVRILTCDEQWFGMTYKEDREVVVSSIRELVKKGVYPDNLWG